jgi:serine protease AprX
VGILRFATERRIESKGLRLARLMVIAMMAILAATGSPANAAPHSRIASDFGKFPVNADGTVDVIIQFTQSPQARHFQMMASHGGKLKTKLFNIKGAAYRIPAKLLTFLETHPDIAYVSPDRHNHPAFDEAAPAVLADVAQQQYGLDGSGVGIAVIDSGVYNHDDLQRADNSGSRIVYSESFVSGDSSSNDAFGHGTHVAGIIAGNGYDSLAGYAQQHTGIAPNANIINLRVLDGQGGGSDSQVIAAIQRAIQLQSTYNIRVINLSLGRPVFESYTQDPLCQAVEAAWQAGIVVVVAAGNDGRDNTNGINGYGTVEAPGNNPNVITVGAINIHATVQRDDDTIASYSSKGPTLLDHVVKPDLVAPGNHITSLLAPDSYLAAQFPSLQVQPLPVCSNGTCSTGTAQYIQLSGTSMATPVVSGAAALMIQLDPTLTPDTVKARLMKTAWKSLPANGWSYDALGNSYFEEYDAFTIGAGSVDVDAVLASTDVANGGAASPTAVYDSTSGQVTLVNSTSVTYGNVIIWGNTSLWANSIVWGPDVVLNNSLVWGDSITWGNESCAGFSIVWSDSITWGDAIDGSESLTWGDSVTWGDN